VAPFARARPGQRSFWFAFLALPFADIACQSGASEGTSGGHANGLSGGASSGGPTMSPSGGAGSGGAPSNGGGPSGGMKSSGGQSSGGAPIGGSSLGGSSEDGGAGTGGTPSGSGGARTDGYEPVWRDEFDGPNIDVSKWEHEVNCWGGGNNEDQCYVADEKNSFIEAGVLHIVVLADSPSGREGGGSENPDNVVTRGHSSGRLRTMNRADFKYGRFEARLMLPRTQGLWPAFWMLPTDNVFGGWAKSGEIDIMEAVNLDPEERIYGTLHYGDAWPNNLHTGAETIPSSKAWENFHLYAVEWEEGEIRWFIDEKHYATQNKWSTVEAPFPAPFNERFHIILNVAIGGSWPGPPDPTTEMPQEMLVDYVRVYRCAADPERGKGCGTRDPAVEPL
jgi:beta-glucanase (GH16 family)